jgi:hypothetical protein
MVNPDSMMAAGRGAARGSRRGSLMAGLPLMILPLIVYNALAFFAATDWQAVVVETEMVRGAVFTLSTGGLLLVATLVLLFLEILKATRTGTGSIVDHLLSTLVFIAALIEFILVDAAATETFFLFTLIALIDVIAGYSITIRAARRDFAVDPNF